MREIMIIIIAATIVVVFLSGLIYCLYKADKEIYGIQPLFHNISNISQ